MRRSPLLVVRQGSTTARPGARVAGDREWDAREGGVEQRTLGRTGLRVSAIGFGCGNTGGLMVRGEPAEQRAAVARGIEGGITYFDTAAQYGEGRSEENLGRVLRELNADVLVGTKVRLTPEEVPDAAAMLRR